MKTLFTNNDLTINVSRNTENGHIFLSITSDFSGSNHKSIIYLNEKKIKEIFDDFWKKTHTTTRLTGRLLFNEIDNYEASYGPYYTPAIVRVKGKRSSSIRHQTHTEIPKDWSVHLELFFNDMKKSTPILNSIKVALGSLIKKNQEEMIEKKLKLFLKKGLRYERLFYDEDDN